MKEMLPLMQKKSTILFLHQPPTTLSGPSVTGVLPSRVSGRAAEPHTACNFPPAALGPPAATHQA